MGALFEYNLIPLYITFLARSTTTQNVFQNLGKSRSYFNYMLNNFDKDLRGKSHVHRMTVEFKFSIQEQLKKYIQYM